ncbi:MAG: FkbM family methyltransferase [Verrucomicrobia bacterium]|nr:FkbM family methyltransferase [Verrucomicrobiota bacterium]
MMQTILYKSAERIRALCNYKLPNIFYRLPNRMGQFLGSGVTEVLPGTKMVLNLNDRLQHTLFVNALKYESEIQSLIARTVKNGKSLFLDIGANAGYMSYVALNSCPTTIVYAFEPNPILVEQIARGIEINKYSSFKVFQMALGEQDSQIELNIHPMNAGWATLNLGDELNNEEWEKCIVPLKKLDDVITQEEISRLPIDQIVIKMDIEGNEVKALKGMSELLRNEKLKLIIAEIYQKRLEAAGNTQDELFTLLQSNGFVVYADSEFKNEVSLPYKSNSPWNAYFQRK